MRKIEKTIASNDAIHQLHVEIWEPEKTIAIVEIVHGMVEYIDRYDEFATYLSEQGFYVIGCDLLGHGHNVRNNNEHGYFCEYDSSKILVKDIHSVMEYARSLNPNVPCFILGHSMGSFLSRRYIMDYPYIDGAIFSGTGSQPGIALGFAKALTAIIKRFKGDHYRPKIMQKLVLGSNNNRIPDALTPNDWLSRNQTNVEKYNRDPFCTFPFTVNGYNGLFSTIAYIQESRNIERIPKDLPIMLISGSQDPIGAYEKGVIKVYNALKAHHVRNIMLKFYPEDRHEILNEIDRKDVYQDIYDWLCAHLH